MPRMQQKYRDAKHDMVHRLLDIEAPAAQNHIDLAKVASELPGCTQQVRPRIIMQLGLQSSTTSKI